MNGCIIPGTNIAVDFWKIRDQPYTCLTFFLTHLHGDHVVGLTSSWTYPIYCTEITAVLLAKRYGLDSYVLRPLEVGESHMITTNEKEQTTITVTVIDANHCPGAAMFLFEGDFGKILHTGDFRYHPEMFSPTSPLSSHIATIDVVYLDNTFCSPDCVFPSREEAQAEILRIVRRHPDHDVVIGMRQLGKEKLLLWLAEQLQEWISVSGDMFEVAQVLDFPQVFRVQDANCRIRTVPFQMVCKRNIKKWNVTRPTIAILPTSIYTGIGGQPFVNQDNVFVVPYSDHCSYAELKEFVSKLKCSSLVPIVSADAKGPFNVSLKDRANMSVFDHYCQSGNNQRSVLLRTKRKTDGMHFKLDNLPRKPKVKKFRSNSVFKRNIQKGVHFESLEVENHFQMEPKTRTPPKEKHMNSKHEKIVFHLLVENADLQLKETEQNIANKNLCPQEMTVTSAVTCQNVCENRTPQEGKDVSSDLLNLISDPINETTELKHKGRTKDVARQSQCSQEMASPTAVTCQRNTETRCQQNVKDMSYKSLNSLSDPLNKSANLMHMEVGEEKIQRHCSQEAAATSTVESNHNDDKEIKYVQSQGFHVHHLEHILVPSKYKDTQKPSAVPANQEHPSFPESQGFVTFNTENVGALAISEMHDLGREQDLSDVNREMQPPQAANVVSALEEGNAVSAEDQKVCDLKEHAVGEHIDCVKESCQPSGSGVIQCIESNVEHSYSCESDTELSASKSDCYDSLSSPLTGVDVNDLTVNSQQKQDTEGCDENFVLSDVDIFTSDDVPSQGLANTYSLSSESLNVSDTNAEIIAQASQKQSPDMHLGETEQEDRCERVDRDCPKPSIPKIIKRSKYFTQSQPRIDSTKLTFPIQSKVQCFSQKLEHKHAGKQSSQRNVSTLDKNTEGYSVDNNFGTSLCSQNIPYGERFSDGVSEESGDRTTSNNVSVQELSVSGRQGIKRKHSADKSISKQHDTVETEHSVSTYSERRKRQRCDLNERSCILNSRIRLSVKPLTFLSEEERRQKSRNDTILCLQNWLNHHK